MVMLWTLVPLFDAKLSNERFFFQNGVSQKGWKGEQNNTAQRLYRKHIKKHAEDNKAHRKHRHSEGDGYSLKRGKWRAGTLVNALKMAKIRPNLHTGQYASSVHCSLWPWPETDAGGATVAPWGRPKCQQVSLQDNSRRGQWTCHTHPWFRLQLVESNNCHEGHCISSICQSQHQLLHCLVYWHWLCSDFLQRYPQLSRPIQGSCPCSRGSGSNHRAFYLSSGQRAP